MEFPTQSGTIWKVHIRRPGGHLTFLDLSSKFTHSTAVLLCALEMPGCTKQPALLWPLPTKFCKQMPRGNQGYSDFSGPR